MDKQEIGYITTYVYERLSRRTSKQRHADSQCYVDQEAHGKQEYIQAADSPDDPAQEHKAGEHKFLIAVTDITTYIFEDLCPRRDKSGPGEE